MRYHPLLLALLAAPSLAIQPQQVPWSTIEVQGPSTQATANIGTIPVIARLTVHDCNVQSAKVSVGSETISLPPIALLSDGCPRPSKIILLQSSCCFAVVASARPEDETLYIDLVVPLEEPVSHRLSGTGIKFSFTYKPGTLRILWPLE